MNLEEFHEQLAAQQPAAAIRATKEKSMTYKTQPEALRLADHLEQFRSFPDDLAAAAELRRLHTENEAKDDLLRQALEALEVSTRFVYADMRPQCEDAIAALRERLGGKT